MTSSPHRFLRSSTGRAAHGGVSFTISPARQRNLFNCRIKNDPEGGAAIWEDAWWW